LDIWNRTRECLLDMLLAPVDCIPELQDAVCRLDVYIFCSSLVS
jgi:hypothetical protein